MLNVLEIIKIVNRILFRICNKLSLILNSRIAYMCPLRCISLRKLFNKERVYVPYIRNFKLKCIRDRPTYDLVQKESSLRYSETEELFHYLMHYCFDYLIYNYILINNRIKKKKIFF